MTDKNWGLKGCVIVFGVPFEFFFYVIVFFLCNIIL